MLSVAPASNCRRCFKEETFGPLLPLFKFSTEDEVVQLANNTQVGNHVQTAALIRTCLPPLLAPSRGLFLHTAA